MKLSPDTRPIRQSQIESDLLNLGLKSGDTVIVHSSLSKMGFVLGGERAVIDSLMKVVTEKGNLVMPAHSSTLTEPMHWENPPIPKEWWQLYREESKPFDINLTPTSWMGKIPELFRQYPNVYRSNHPSNSFSAWGINAKEMIETHSLGEAFGTGSPLQKIYDFNGKVLLLGVDHDSNTSMHLAESKIKSFPKEKQGAPMLVNNKREWIEFEERIYDNDDFLKIGLLFEKENQVSKGNVGQAECKLMNQKELVDYTLEKIKVLRKFN